MKYRKCPLCGNNNIDKIYSLHFTNNEEVNKLPNIYDIVICNNCLMVYDSFFYINQDEFDNYYKYNSTYNEATHVSNDTNNYGNYYLEIINYLCKYLKQDFHILDAGCGSGTILKLFEEKKFNNLYGADKSDAFLSNLKSSKIKNLDINILENNKDYNNKFNLIVVNHVLEHIFDLNTAINNLKNMLSENGYLYIAVPDLLEYINYYNTPFMKFGIEHINHFCKTSILNLASIYGFDVIDYGKRETYVNLSEIYFLLKKNNDHNQLNNDYNIIVHNVIDYINKSKEGIKNIVNKFSKSNEKIIIWGIGTSSLSLFSLGLENLNIISIVDSSKRKQGKYINGIKIISPKEITDEDATILILPELYYDNIYKQIKEMGLKNKVEFLTDKQINI